MITLKKGSLAALTALAFAIGFGRPLSAENGTTVNFQNFVKEVSIKGDLRLRHENFYRSNLTGEEGRSRNRQRFRLRVGTDFKLENNLEAKLRFASGGGDSTSTNQTFDNNSEQKGFWIDRAYLLWKPINRLQLAGGRMNNPFWIPYSGDVVWDGDYNPEGVYQKFELPVGESNKVFINALQMVVDEDRNGTKEQWMFGQQIGLQTNVANDTKITLAAALYEWVNERANDFDRGSGVQDGNRRVFPSSGTLLSEFQVMDFTGEVNSKIAGLPISLQGTYIKNRQASLSPKEDTGYQYGTILGKASNPKTWELAYFYKKVETDATVADIADSDFGWSGGTNRKGHIFWGAFSPTKHVKVQAKHFITKTANESFSPNEKPVNRTQLDVSVKF